MLHLHEEALVPAPTLRSELTLGLNLAMSNVHTVIYSLFTIFRRFSRGTPLSLPRPPCDRFLYGLTSLTDTYAWGFRKMLTPPPLTSEFVGMASYAPASFHNLMDDDVESDGSSIGDVVAPSTLCPRSALWQRPWDSRWWQRSLYRPTPLRTLERRPSHVHRSTARSYDKGGRTSQLLRRCARRSMLSPTRVTR